MLVKGHSVCLKSCKQSGWVATVYAQVSTQCPTCSTSSLMVPETFLLEKDVMYAPELKICCVLLLLYANAVALLIRACLADGRISQNPQILQRWRNLDALETVKGELHALAHCHLQDDPMTTLLKACPGCNLRRLGCHPGCCKAEAHCF